MTNTWPQSDRRYNAAIIRYACDSCGELRIVQSLDEPLNLDCPRCGDGNCAVRVLGLMKTRRALPIRERLNDKRDFARHSTPRLLARW